MVRPLIRLFSGLGATSGLRTISARLTHPLSSHHDHDTFIRVNICIDQAGENTRVTPLFSSPGLLSSLKAVDGYIRLDKGQPPLAAGSLVQVSLFPWRAFSIGKHTTVRFMLRPLIKKKRTIRVFPLSPCHPSCQRHAMALCMWQLALQIVQRLTVWSRLKKETEKIRCPFSFQPYHQPIFAEYIKTFFSIKANCPTKADSPSSQNRRRNKKTWANSLKNLLKTI